MNSTYDLRPTGGPSEIATAHNRCLIAGRMCARPNASRGKSWVFGYPGNGPDGHSRKEGLPGRDLVFAVVVVTLLSCRRDTERGHRSALDMGG